MALGRAFDPELADLYADEAVIQHTRVYPTGATRALDFRGAEYKPLVRAAMPTARRRGDRDRFENVRYEPAAGGRVRITATRYNELKRYRSPFTLVVGPDASGTWRVIEERSQSQP